MNSPLRKQCFPPADSSLLVSYDEAGGRLPFFSSPWLLPQPLPLKQAPRGAQTTRTAKIFSFSVPSSRREGGRQGEWAKKCLPRHECAADILTLFPIAKPNMVLACSSAGKSHNKRSCRHPVCAPSCCRHMPPRSAHQSSGCPPRMWMCRWCTVCPAFSPWLTTRR